MPHNLAPNQPPALAALSPLQVVERLIGPPEAIGRAISISEKAAYHWRNQRTYRAAGDLPSADVMRRLLAHSEANNLGLTAEHLIRGAAEDEIAAILAARGAPARGFLSRRRLPPPGRMGAAE